VSKRGRKKLLADQAKSDAKRREIIGQLERARIHRNMVLAMYERMKEKKP
jgi:hypothetical protein